MTDPRQNTRGREDLLIPEARRSLEGFAASLRQSGDGQLQASLHAKDLAVALMNLGQAGPSEIFSELSRQLALRNPGVLAIAERFATRRVRTTGARGSPSCVAGPPPRR
jgi:hypothetical protein